MNAHAIRDEHELMMSQLYTEALFRVANHGDVVEAMRAYVASSDRSAP